MVCVGGSSFAGPVSQVRAVVIYVLFDCRCKVGHVGGSGRKTWESSSEAGPGRESGEVVGGNMCAVIVAVAWVFQSFRCPLVCKLVALNPDV